MSYRQQCWSGGSARAIIEGGMMNVATALSWRARTGRIALIAMGILSLLCGIWGGLIRLPLLLPLPASNAKWLTFHGPLMVCGFLGTVISLERAVGLRHIWTVMLCFSPLESGLRYDAVLHSFFLGFVFSMIFGHAPVIFPAVLGVRPCFRSRFYLQVALLHAALILRVGADVANWGRGRQWGGIGTAVAVGVFLLNTISSLLVAKGPSAPKKTQPVRHQ